MSTVPSSLFPENPKHGTLYELRRGLVFQYDATVKSWIKVTASDVILPIASVIEPGIMTAVDLKKLNRLVIPPPISSIRGTDCFAPFSTGIIGFYSGDKFVNVEGNANVRNIGPNGEVLTKDLPFKIHQHTYAFDFNLDLPSLVQELQVRKQLNLEGAQGLPGEKGEKGAPGPDHIFSGPPGDVGEQGDAPPCELAVEEDELEAEPRDGWNRGLVGVKAVPDGENKYRLVFDRQAIGPVGVAASRFFVEDEQSPWLLALTTAEDVTQKVRMQLGEPGYCTFVTGTRPLPIYYIDVDPMLDNIRNRFLREVERLRDGYEEIVRFWIQTMSDLFDEQKAALCCALEYCMSITKNQEVREHMESMAASAAGVANIRLHGRDSEEAVELSSTRILKQLHEDSEGEAGGQDMCRSGPRFPQRPDNKFKQNNPEGNGNGQGGGGGVNPSSAKPLAKQHIEVEGNALETPTVREARVVIDPLLHSSVATAYRLLMHPGDYTVVITHTDAQIGLKHRANVKIQHIAQGARRTVQFLDKGEFLSVRDAQNAYEGLSLSFHHEGGEVAFWLPVVSAQNVAGTITVEVAPATGTPPQEMIPPVEATPAAQALPEPVRAVDADSGERCEMSLSHLSWYEKGWATGNCCGLVINVMGLDYIVVKRSLGNELACGGGESETTPCLAKFLNTDKGHPAFAWPTFDGKTFAPLPAGDSVTFEFNERLNEVVSQKIANGQFENAKGNPSGIRHMTYQLMTVLFPVMS